MFGGGNDNIRPTSQGGTRWNIQDLVKRTSTQRTTTNNPSGQTSTSALMAGGSGLENVSNNRLAKKLIDIHSGIDNNHNKQYPSQIMPSNKEMQKRIALDDCSNFLQQKMGGMQQQQQPGGPHYHQSSANQQYPSSTSAALQNILNSNRSGSSNGFLSSKNNLAGPGGIGAAVSSFKFNMTLNKNKGGQHPHMSTQDYQNYQEQVTEEMSAEDNEAQMIHQNRGRGHSQGLTQGLRQPLFKLVKNYEDNNQNNAGAARRNSQTNYNKMQHQASKTTTEINEIEERQTIFEEEIIKRIQEIQKYTKNLHLQIKKIQTNAGGNGSSSNKNREEEWLTIQQNLNELREQMAYGQVNEQQVCEILEDRLQRVENDRQLSIEALDAKMTREMDQKIKANQQANNNSIQSLIQGAREDIISQIVDQLLPDLKKEILKSQKEGVKTIEKQNTSQQLKIEDMDQIIEEIRLQQDSFYRENNSKQDKLNKTFREYQEEQERQWQTKNEDLKQLIEKMKKQILKEAKQELDLTSLVSQEEFSQQIDTLNAKIEKIKTSAINSSKSKDLDNSILEKMNSNQAELDHLQSEIDCLKLSIDSLENRGHQIQGFKDELSNSQEQLEHNFNQKLNTVQNEINTLKQQQTEQDSKNSPSPRVQNVQQIDEEALELRLQSYSDEGVKKLEREIKEQLEYQRSQVNQRALRTELQEMNQESNDKISTIKKQSKKLEERLSEFDQSINQQFISINSNHETQQQSIEQLEQDIQNLAAQIQQDKGEINQTEDVDQLKENLQELKTYINQIFQAVQDDIVKLKEDQQNENLNKQETGKDDFDDKFYELQQSIEELQEKISSLVSREELQQQLALLKSQLDPSQQLSNLEQQQQRRLEDLRTQVDQIQENLNERGYQYDQQQEEIEQLKVSIAEQPLVKEENFSSQVDHTKHIESLEQNQKTLQEQFNAMEEQLKNANLENIESNMETIVEEMNLMKNQIEEISQSNDLNALVEEIEAIKGQIAESNKNITTLAQQNQPNKQEPQQNEQVEDLRNLVDRLAEDVQGLQELSAKPNQQNIDQYDSLKEDTEDLKREMEQVMAALEQEKQKVVLKKEEVQDMINQKADEVLQQTVEMIDVKIDQIPIQQVDNNNQNDNNEQYEGLMQKIQSQQTLIDELKKNQETHYQELQELDERAVSGQKVDMIEEGLESQIMKLQSQLKTISQANSDIVIKLGGLTSDVTEQQEEFKQQIEQEIKQLKTQFNQVEQKLKDMISQSVRLNLEHDQVKAPLTKVQSALEEQKVASVQSSEQKSEQNQHITEEQQEDMLQFNDSPLKSNRSNLFQGTQRLGTGHSQQHKQLSSGKKGSNPSFAANHPHFLEDLSDVELEQNSKGEDQFGNTMDEGDMMFHNNRTNSLQNSTILSNNKFAVGSSIITPIGAGLQNPQTQAQPQFLFNEGGNSGAKSGRSEKEQLLQSSDKKQRLEFSGPQNQLSEIQDEEAKGSENEEVKDEQFDDHNEDKESNIEQQHPAQAKHETQEAEDDEEEYDQQQQQYEQQYSSGNEKDVQFDSQSEHNGIVDEEVSYEEIPAPSPTNLRSGGILAGGALNDIYQDSFDEQQHQHQLQERISNINDDSLNDNNNENENQDEEEQQIQQQQQQLQQVANPRATTQNVSRSRYGFDDSDNDNQEDEEGDQNALVNQLEEVSFTEDNENALEEEIKANTNNNAEGTHASLKDDHSQVWELENHSQRLEQQHRQQKQQHFGYDQGAPVFRPEEKSAEKQEIIMDDFEIDLDADDDDDEEDFQVEEERKGDKFETEKKSSIHEKSVKNLSSYQQSPDFEQVVSYRQSNQDSQRSAAAIVSHNSPVVKNSQGSPDVFAPQGVESVTKSKYNTYEQESFDSYNEVDQEASQKSLSNQKNQQQLVQPEQTIEHNSPDYEDAIVSERQERHSNNYNINQNTQYGQLPSNAVRQTVDHINFDANDQQEEDYLFEQASINESNGEQQQQQQEHYENEQELDEMEEVEDEEGADVADEQEEVMSMDVLGDKVATWLLQNELQDCLEDVQQFKNRQFY